MYADFPDDMWYSDLVFLKDLENLGEFNLDEDIFEPPWYLDNVFLDDLNNLQDFNLDFFDPFSAEDYNKNLFGGLNFSLKPEINETFNKKWNSSEKSISFTLKNIEFKNFFEANGQVKTFFEQIYNEYILPIKPNDFVRYVIEHDIFDKAINTDFMRRREISATMIQGNFENVFQSRKKNLKGQSSECHRFKFTVKTFPSKIIVGGSNQKLTTSIRRKRGRPSSNISHPCKKLCKEKKEIINMRDFIEHSPFIKVINFDNLCLVRAFLIGKAFTDKEKNARNLLRVNNRELNKRVNDLNKIFNFPQGFLGLRNS